MVTLRLKREECQIMLTWASTAEHSAKDVGVPFEPDEVALVKKIEIAWEKSKHPELTDNERAAGIEGPVRMNCPECGSEMTEDEDESGQLMNYCRRPSCRYEEKVKR